MIGRLIIALLVICSAGAVMWQRQQAEAADVSAAVSEDKFDDANKKIASLEKALEAAQAQTAEVEARNKWLEQELAQLSSDCTPAADDELNMSIAAFKWRELRASPRGGEGHFTLVLGGAAADVMRIRVVGTPRWDPTQHSFVWDSINAESWKLVVNKGGKAIPLDSARSLTLAKPKGAMHLDLALDDGGFFAQGALFQVEVILKNGHSVTTRTAIAE